MICSSASLTMDTYLKSLAQTLAKKLYGDSNPLDKVIQIDGKTNVKVTGVFKNLPNNSEFSTTSFIAPFDLYGADKNDWRNYNMFIFAQLNPNARHAAQNQG